MVSRRVLLMLNASTLTAAIRANVHRASPAPDNLTRNALISMNAGGVTPAALTLNASTCRDHTNVYAPKDSMDRDIYFVKVINIY